MSIILILQIALHILVALSMASGMEDAPYRWEFWSVMLAIPAIRMADAWDRYRS